MVSTIIEWQFAHDAITKLHIEHMVILTCLEHGITRVLLGAAHSTHIRAVIALVLVEHFTDLFPFALCHLPHVCLSDCTVFENLDFSFGRAHEFTLNLCLKVLKVIHVWSCLRLSTTLAITLVFSEIRAFITSLGILCEGFEGFVLTTNDKIAKLVMC